MLGITLSDLRFRARQFLIAVLGAGLVFAMSLLLSGLAHGFSVEIDQTVLPFDASAWVVAQGSSGRVAALPPMPELAELATDFAPGVHSAAPVVIQPKETTFAGSVVSAVVIGTDHSILERIGVQSGHTVSGSGQVVADVRLGVPLGAHIRIAGRTFRVVGLVSGRTLVGGLPDVYMTLPTRRRWPSTGCRSSTPSSRTVSRPPCRPGSSPCRTPRCKPPPSTP